MDDSFWTGYVLDDVLFKNLSVDSPTGFCCLLVGIFIVSFGFEGIRVLKEFFFTKFLESKSVQKIELPKLKYIKHIEDGGNFKISSKVVKNEPACCSVSSKNVISHISQSTDNVTSNKIQTKSSNIGEWFDLTISSVLHMFHVSIGYCLMLVVMTFNLWIFITVISGVCVGFFLFDILRRKYVYRESTVEKNDLVQMRMNSYGNVKNSSE